MQVTFQFELFIQNTKSRFIDTVIYSGGFNIEHWNTDHIGILNILDFSFWMVQQQNGSHCVGLSNYLDHWKTKLLASLDRFIYKHNFL